MLHLFNFQGDEQGHLVSQILQTQLEFNKKNKTEFSKTVPMLYYYIIFSILICFYFFIILIVIFLF